MYQVNATAYYPFIGTSVQIGLDFNLDWMPRKGDVLEFSAEDFPVLGESGTVKCKVANISSLIRPVPASLSAGSKDSNPAVLPAKTILTIELEQA